MTFSFCSYRGKNKSFYHHSSDQSKTGENVDPSLKTGNLVIQTEEVYTNILMKQRLKVSFCALLHQILSLFMYWFLLDSQRGALSACPARAKCPANCCATLSSLLCHTFLHGTPSLTCHVPVCSAFSKLCFWLAADASGS